MVLAATTLAAQDVITVGSGATCIQVPLTSTTATIPIRVRDVSGTLLGGDKPTRPLNGITVGVRPHPRAAVVPIAGGKRDITFSSAIGPTDDFQTDGSLMDGWYYARWEQPLPVALNGPAPGTTILNMTVHLRPLWVGAVVNFELDTDEAKTQLATGYGQYIESAARGGLQLVNGCIQICQPDVAVTVPASISVRSGTSTTLTANPAGTPPFSYQWYTGSSGGGTPITGATAASYLTPVLTTNQNYWVRVSNACSSTNSNTITASVCTTAPGISAQPTSRSVRSGTATTLSVTANGASPFTYQWYEGTAPSTNTPVGSNAPTFTVTLTTTKSYWVKVSNACGSRNSTTATATVCTAAPTITAQPLDKTITCVSPPAVLSVTGGGSGPFSYQWYRGTSGVTTNPITGATSASYDASSTTTTSTYWVRVSNACGNVNSRTTTVTVRPPAPSITQQPASQTIYAENTATMTVLATGTGTLEYWWYNGTSGDMSIPVTGANSFTYTTPVLYNTRSYWVGVSDDCGAANSNTATITVLP